MTQLDCDRAKRFVRNVKAGFIRKNRLQRAAQGGKLIKCSIPPQETPPQETMFGAEDKRVLRENRATAFDSQTQGMKM